MSINLSIDHPVVAALFEGALIVFLIAYLVGYRLFPRMRLDRYFHIGGPWHLFRSGFWEERGLRSRPGMLVVFLWAAVFFAVVFFCLDALF